MTEIWFIFVQLRDSTVTADFTAVKSHVPTLQHCNTSIDEGVDIEVTI